MLSIDTSHIISDMGQCFSLGAMGVTDGLLFFKKCGYP